MEYFKLKNGVRVVLIPMSGVQSTAVGVYLNVGSRFEAPEVNGIAHFAEHMTFKGTKNYPTPKDTSSLEGLGAMQNASTNFDATAYYCKIPSDYWQQGLDLIKDLALYPIYPEKDLDMERGVIIEEINREEDQPDERVWDVLMDLMYSPNPLGRRILGTPEIIRKLTRSDFQNYHQTFYTSHNIVVGLAGKFDSLAARQEIERHFGLLPDTHSSSFTPFLDTQAAPQIKLYSKDTAEQAHIELAVRGLTVLDPRRYALSVLNAILGAGMSSRLFVQVREKRGLCYSISSDSMRLPDTGLWSVHAGLNIAKLEEAVVAILDEMRRVTMELVPQEELAEAQRKLKGSLIFSQENPSRQMDYYVHQALVHDDLIDYDTHINRLMGVTAADIQNVARDLFVTEKLSLAIVGPVKNSEALLKLLKI